MIDRREIDIVPLKALGNMTYIENFSQIEDKIDLEKILERCESFPFNVHGYAGRKHQGTKSHLLDISVVKRHYLKGMTFSEIGREDGYTSSRSRERLLKGLRKLKRIASSKLLMSYNLRPVIDGYSNARIRTTPLLSKIIITEAT